jgi:CotS family spore coat protein
MGKKERWEEREIYEEFVDAGYDPEILREYDLIPERARQVRGVLRLKTRSGYRMLKRVNTSEARLKFVFEALEYIYPRFSHVPRFIRTKYADPYVVTMQGLYYLTDWLPGREAELKKPKHLFIATEMLGRLHQAGKGYEAHGFVDAGKGDFLATLTTYRTKIDSYVEFATERANQTAFDLHFLAQKDQLITLMEHALEQLQSSPYHEVLESAKDAKTLCHGSFSKQNVLIDGKTASIVDFDHCHYGPPVCDIGAFLHRYMPKYSWDVEVGQSILDIYQGVRPLSQEEMHVLLAYMSFPLKPVQIVSWYYEGLRGWSDEKYGKQLTKALQAETGRDIFIRDLAGRYNLAVHMPTYTQETDFEEMEGEFASPEETEQEDTLQEQPQQQQLEENEEEQKAYEEVLEQAVLTRVQKQKKRGRKTEENVKTSTQNGLWVDEERIRPGNQKD